MKSQKIFQWVRILLFSGILIGFCVWGFILPLRPTVSDTEGRELTKFPAFTWESFLSGEYTSQISLWYADTFPLRDKLLDMSGALKGLYGVGDSDFSGYEGNVDTIGTDNDFEWVTPGEPETSADTEPNQPPSSETIDGYYVEGDTCWQLYYYKKDLVERYCRTVVQTALDLDGIAKVYNMVVPTNYCYTLPAEKRDELGASDGLAVIERIYETINAYGPQAGLQTPVGILPVHEIMGDHIDEYIYFRTDHHWTGLGAYYASRYFLDAMDKTYPALEDYETFTYDIFTGSLYVHTQNENLKNSPDTLVAYIPLNVSNVLTLDRHGNAMVHPLINKNIAVRNKYLTFCSGDHAYYEVHNESITDGSSVLIIRESFGNAFIPMIADSYEYVYAVDYRYWREDLRAFVEEKGIDTVLFLNNLMATGDKYNVSCLEKMIYTLH
ncbi:MAG: hypothetical protein E7610_09405 [Ruminococcaceae bacterium]|nr:hypothetical protein [Oscillospiraceae bacterium]